MQHYTFKTLLSEQIQAESNNKASRPGNIGDIKLNDTMKKKKKINKYRTFKKSMLQLLRD